MIDQRGEEGEGFVHLADGKSVSGLGIDPRCFDGYRTERRIGASSRVINNEKSGTRF